MIVVDTNVLVALALPSEDDAAAEQLFSDDPDWVAPLLWRSEFRNVLASRMRKGGLSPEQALAFQLEMESLLDEREYPVDSGAVLTLADESGCTAYDCEFVSLAIQLGVPLVTMDAQVLKAFPRLARPLAPTSQRR